MMASPEPLPRRTVQRAAVDAEPGDEGRAEGRGDERLVGRLRQGDEAAFAALVEEHHASMIRVARLHVESAAAAEEVAQQAWLGVLRGLGSFEGRCSLKAWIFSIVSNLAKSRGARDKRTVPLSSLAREDEDGASVNPDRFLRDDHPRWPGHWAHPPQAWSEDDLVSRETLSAVRAAMETLPPMQRAVMTIRDVEGLGSEEACQALGISEANQRVLLHRARSKVRKALEGYLREDEVSLRSEQAAPPHASPQRVGRRAVNERGACGGVAGEAPTALPAEGGEGLLEMYELAERSEAFP